MIFRTIGHDYFPKPQDRLVIRRDEIKSTFFKILNFKRVRILARINRTIIIPSLPVDKLPTLIDEYFSKNNLPEIGFNFELKPSGIGAETRIFGARGRRYRCW